MKNRGANVPMRTNEVAAILGWSTDRAARYLDGLCEKDPSIVIRVRGRRLVTLASIRRVDPDFGKHFASEFEVKELRQEQEEQKREIDTLVDQQARSKRAIESEISEIRAWLRRVEAMCAGAPATVGQKALAQKRQTNSPRCVKCGAPPGERCRPGPCTDAASTPGDARGRPSGG